MASIENENIIEIGDVDPIICGSINIYSVYSFPSILIRRCWLFWLPPLFNQLWASEVAIFMKTSNQTKILNKVLD